MRKQLAFTHTESSVRVLPALRLALLSCLLLSGAAAARTKVIVATDSWARLMYLDQHKAPAGPMADFINRMNAVQDRFDFELRIYPRLRVDSVFADKQADVFPLRTVAWTRPELGLLATTTIIASGDVYFARRANRYGGHKIFDQLARRRIVGVRGYHYHIFDNNPDEAVIRKNHNAYLVASNEAVIDFVMAGRAEVGIVPEAILATYFADKRYREQLIVSEFYDSRVELSNLVRSGGPVSVEDMNHIVELMVKSGDVQALRDKLSLRRAALRK